MLSHYYFRHKQIRGRYLLMADDTKVFGMSANTGRLIFVLLGMVINF